MPSGAVPPGHGPSYRAVVRVEVVRSGGFAGRVLRWSVDVDELDADTATELRGLLDQAPDWDAAGAAAEDAAPTARGGGVPDGFRWRVLSDVPAGGLDLAFAEPVPGPAQRFVDLVRAAGPALPPEPV